MVTLEQTMNSDDRVRIILRELIRRSGLNDTAVSRAIKRNHAYIHQFLNRGKPARLPTPVRFALGRLLNVDPDALRNGEDAPNVRRPRRDELDPRLVERASSAVDVILSGFGCGPRVEAEAFAAVYALLERERAGHPITDDKETLRRVRNLVARVKELHVRVPREGVREQPDDTE